MRTVQLSFLLIFFVHNSFSQITSTFDVNNDGWTTINANGDPTPTYSSTGGNPGGNIQAFDLPVGASVPIPYFVAPAKFLGNRSFSYGKNLRFDIHQRF